ncbi:MAG TPA: hypothetical protein VFV35_01855, partial [Acidimicrobiales bacterium]|nr:hypothetical protein [Acidimicrobiales bacterium]
GAELPPAFGRPGALAVAGECEGFYFSDGDAVNAVDRSPWNMVELARSGGHVVLELDVPPRPPGTRVPVIDAGDDRLELAYLDGSVRVDHASNDVDRTGVRLPYPDGGRLRLDIWADRRVHHVVVFSGSVAALDNFWFEPEPLSVSWPFGHDELPVDTPLCDRLVGR